MTFRTSDEGCANTLIVVTYIQRCQAEVQKAQAEELELHRKRMAHIDQNLAEITDKLNGLNGYVSGQQEVSQYTSTPRRSALVRQRTINAVDDWCCGFSNLVDLCGVQ